MRGKSPSEAELRRAFDAYDVKASGKIDADELTQALKLLGWEANHAQVEAMIAQVDEEGDGVLLFSEFASLMRTALLSDEAPRSRRDRAEIAPRSRRDREMAARRWNTPRRRRRSAPPPRAQVRLRVREGGTRAHVLSTGEMLNVANVIDSPLCSQDVYALRGYDAPISPRAYSMMGPLSAPRPRSLVGTTCATC